MLAQFFKKRWLDYYQQMNNFADIKAEKEEDEVVMIYINDNEDENTEKNNVEQKLDNSSEGSNKDHEMIDIQKATIDSSNIKNNIAEVSTPVHDSVEVPPTTTLLKPMNNKLDVEKNVNSNKRRKSVANIRQIHEAPAKKTRLSTNDAKVHNATIVNESKTEDNKLSKTNIQGTKSLKPSSSLQSPRAKKSTVTTVVSPGQANDPMRKYLSKPTCTQCNTTFITWAESRFHSHFHRNKRCCVCDKKVNESTIKDHVYSCLLFSKKLTSKELLAYMRPCSIHLIRSDHVKPKHPVIKRISKATKKGKQVTNLANDPIQTQTSDVEKESDVETVKSSDSTVTAIDSDSSEIIPVKSRKSNRILSSTSCSDADSTTDPDLDSAKKINKNENALPENHTSAKKKAVRRSSSATRSDLITVQLSKNTAFPINWDHEATKEKLFSSYDISKTDCKYNNLITDSNAAPPINNRIKNICETILFEACREQLSKETSRLSLPNDQLVTQTNKLNLPSNRLSQRVKSVMVTIPTGRHQTMLPPIGSRRKSVHALANNKNLIEHRRSSVSQTTLAPLQLTPKFIPITLNSSQSLTPLSNIAPNSNLTNINLNCVTHSANESDHNYQIMNSVESVPAPTVPHHNNFKILSPNELNLRAEQMNAKTNEKNHNGNFRIKFVTPKPKRVDCSNQMKPIHVSLVRRATGELHLTLTSNGTELDYTQLNTAQRIEVQKSLLAQDIWLEMLEHVKNGKPTKETLNAFRRLLPPKQSNIFIQSCLRSGIFTNNNTSNLSSFI